jgi:type IV secretion system protein VirB2
MLSSVDFLVRTVRVYDPYLCFFNLSFKKGNIFMKTQTKDLSLAWQISLMVMLSAVIVSMPDFAFATNTPMGNVLCTVLTWFTGNTGKGLATIAITVIGIGALLGKVSWGMAMIVGIGVAIVFGAAGIVAAMGANTGNVVSNNATCG